MAPAFGSRHSPLALAGPHEPLAATVLLSPVGSHALICHVPVALASKLKPWMRNVHTCGSFSMTDLSSPAPSWILTVPLLPAGSAYAGPAERSKSATAATSVRIPVGLRIGVASSLEIGLGAPRFGLRERARCSPPTPPVGNGRSSIRALSRKCSR